jgi:hypothetical protein
LLAVSERRIKYCELCRLSHQKPSKRAILEGTVLRVKVIIFMGG